MYLPFDHAVGIYRALSREVAAGRKSLMSGSILVASMQPQTFLLFYEFTV